MSPAIPGCLHVSQQAQSGNRIPSVTYSPSMRSQWPVRTQMSTSITDSEKESNSAAVKRPQQPKEILGTTHRHQLRGFVLPFTQQEMDATGTKLNHW